MKVSEIKKRIVCAVLASSMSVACMNFAGVSASDETAILYDKVVEKLDFEDFSAETVLTDAQLAGLGFTLEEKSFNSTDPNMSQYNIEAEKPKATIKRVTYTENGTEKQTNVLCLEIGKKNNFVLTKNLDLSNIANPKKIGIDYTYYVADEADWVNKDGSHETKRIGFSSMGQLFDKDGKSMVYPDMIRQSGSPSDIRFIDGEKRKTRYYGYQYWNTVSYDIDYESNTAAGQFHLLQRDKGWQDDSLKYTYNITGEQTPNTLVWESNYQDFSTLNDDAKIYLYIDDIKVVSKYALNDSIVGNTKEDTDVTAIIYNGNDVVYTGSAVSDADGKYTIPANFTLFGDNSVVEVTANGKTVRRNARYAYSDGNGKTLDMDNFAIDSNPVYIADMKMNGGNNFVCTNGAASISGTVISNSYSGNMTVVAGAYNADGVMKNLETQEISVNQGEEKTFSIDIDTQSDDAIKVYCIDNLERVTLLGTGYKINSGISKLDYTEKFAVNNIDSGKCGFNPITMLYEISGNIDGNGYAAIKAENNGIKYFDIYFNEIPKVIIEDNTANELTYSVKLYDKNGETELPSFKYISSQTYAGYFAELGSDNIAPERFDEIINEPSLGLDAEDYNNLSDAAKADVRRLFAAYNPSSIDRVSQVQDTLDKAVGIGIFIGTDLTANQIKKYSGAVSPDKTRFAAENLSTEVLADIAKILLTKERTEDNISSLFVDTFITARVRNAQSAAELEQYIFTDYADYIKISPDTISKLGLDKNDIFAYMLGEKSNVTSIADIDTLFGNAVEYCRNNTTDSGIKILSVKFLDKDGNEHSELDDYNGKIKCETIYNAEENKDLYAVITYYKNSKVIKNQVTEVKTDSSGKFATDLLDISTIDGKGVYKVEAKFYSSLSSMASCSSESYCLTQNRYDNILNIAGIDLGGFENPLTASWCISYFWSQPEHANGFTSVISRVSKADDENENVRSGNYSGQSYINNIGDGFAIPEDIGRETATADLSPFKKGEKGLGAYFKENGAGSYRVTAYVKPEQTDCNMRLSVNEYHNRNYGNVFSGGNVTKVEKGKWNKIIYDFDVSANKLSQMKFFGIKVSISDCFDENGNSAGCIKQNIYVDDVSLVKLEDNITDSDANYVVCGTGKENTLAELMIVKTAAYNSGNIRARDIAFTGSTKTDKSGNYKFDVTFSGNADEYTAVVNCGGKTYCRPLSYATENDGKQYLEIGYFEPLTKGAYIENVKLSANTPYSQMSLADGTETIKCPVYSVDYSGNAILIVSVFNSKGENKKVYSDEKLLTPGTSTEFEITADTQNGDTAKIFLIDNINSRDILGNAYGISAGLDTYASAGMPTSASNISTIFSPASLSAKVKGTVSEQGYAAAIALEKDAALNIANIRFADFRKTENGVLALVTPCETDENNGKEFDIYLGNCGTVDKQTFTYKKSSAYQSEYDKLNGNPDTQTVESVLKNPELDIDLSKLNQLSGNNYQRALQLFNNYKPSPVTSVIEIQNAIDTAAEIVILATNPTAEMIADLGEKHGFNAQMLAEFKSDAVTDAVRNDTAANMKKNVPATIDADSLKRQFESAYAAAHIKNMSTKYQDFQSLSTGKFAQYIGIDASKATAKGTTVSEVFKKMYSSITSITSTQDILTLYENTVNQTPIVTPGGGSTGGSGSSGSGSGIGILAPTQNTAPTSEIFVDVNADFWAAESILKLKNRGIIAADKYFRPSDSIKREEFVKMIVSAYGYTANGATAKFADAQEGAWYEQYIMAAADNGIISGVGENMFGIGMPITRQDMAVIIYRIIKDSLPEGTEVTFADGDSIAEYAKEAVAALAANKIINGYEDNTFRPDNSLTRAEGARILAAVLDLAQ